jgi:hypothetical protein
MPISFPERRFLTFDELMERWGKKCEENDIRAVIVSGALVPSYFFCGNIGPGNWVEIEDSDYPGSLEFERCLADFPPHAVNGFLFLRSPSETGVNDCMFHLMCDSATEQPSIEGPSSSWYHIPNGGLSLADVESKGMFMMSEVLRFEERGGRAQAQKADLGTRERETLLTIIYAMAVNRYGYDPTQRNEAAAVISSATRLVGDGITAETIRDKLKDGAQIVTKRRKRNSTRA